MQDWQLYDWARLLIAILALYVLYKEGRRYHRIRHSMSSRLNDLWWVYLMSMFLIFYGSLEAIALNAGGGPRQALAFLVVAIAVKAALQKNPPDFEAPREIDLTDPAIREALNEFDNRIKDGKLTPQEITTLLKR